MAWASRHDRRAFVQEFVLFTVSLVLVALVALSISGTVNSLFLAILLSAMIATLCIRLLFPVSSFFSHTFTNLVAVYASIFAFFVEQLFGQIGPATAGFGFCLPLLSFVIGCWFRRADIKAVIERPEIRGGPALYGALGWLLPVFLVGGALFILSSLSEDLVNTSVVFLFAMLAIGLIVIAVSRDVAIFLVDAGLLFEEFFQRMSKLAVPAFAFLTFYALLVILFASIFSIVSQFSTEEHFRVGSVPKSLSFSEAIHFSIVTISTVICGVMLLLFCVSELIEYTREHRANRRAK
jgi:voltage-gated potassium channel